MATAVKKAEKAKGRQNIGAGVAPPANTCTDRNCPWHGRLPVRGRILSGRVRSAKSHSTAVIEWAYNRFVPKFERYERRNSRVTAHNPPCIKAREGDSVVIAECRPISKTKSFVIVSASKPAEAGQ
jgi:small subunit ribosomal protein S17